jgi:LysM repeat protein
VKALFILLLACAIFGTAGYFTYELFVKPKVELQREKDAPPTPSPADPTLPELKKCLALKEKGQLIEARHALEDFLDRFPESSGLEQAREALGEVNTRIFLSPVPAPEKQIYIVKSGDVLNRVANRTKTTAELLMKANNLQGTMLRIGQKLYTSPANFSLVISRKRSKITLLNDGRFFKQYPVRQWPLALQQTKKGPVAKQAGKVLEKIAWLDGNRVIFSDKGYADATHWINLSIPHCTLYSEPPAGADPKTVSKPPSGIAISPEAAAELAAMLSRGNPVTLE